LRAQIEQLHAAAKARRFAPAEVICPDFEVPQRKTVRAMALKPAATVASAAVRPSGTTATDRTSCAIGRFQPGTFLLGRVHAEGLYQEVMIEATYANQSARACWHEPEQTLYKWPFQLLTSSPA
jgi:hypothetical protein